MNNLIFVSLISLLVGIIITYVFELILKTNKKLRNKYYNRHNILWGHHVHHSTYGLLFMLIGIALYFLGNSDSALNSIMCGIGVIIQHTNSDGHFVFIERQK